MNYKNQIYKVVSSENREVSLFKGNYKECEVFKIKNRSNYKLLLIKKN